MAVTPDKLELPVYIADTPKELANRYGLTADNVLSQIANNMSGKTRGVKFVRVIIDDE